MFGRKSRAERLKEQAGGARAFVPVATVGALYSEARPVAERLLYDDELRDNIRTLVESINEIYGEISNEDPRNVVARLWDDDKLRERVEAATNAVYEGSRRVRGEKVKSNGGGGGFFLLLLIAGAGVGALFLHPKTGPQARKLAREAFETLQSST